MFKELKLRFVADTSSATAGIKKIDNSTSSFGDTVKKKVGLDTVTSYAAAGAAVVAFAKSAIDAYADHQKAVATLQTALNNSPAIIDKSTAAYADQATTLQNLTGRQDEEILRADAILANFGLTKDQIEQTIPTILDYAQTTGQDASGAAESFGKALLGNTRALKNVGIAYKTTGDRATDLANISELLQAKVGGASEAFGETFAGKIEILKAQFDDLKETLGAQLVPILSDFADTLSQVTTAIDSLLQTIPGLGGLGGLFSKLFNASPVGIFADGISAVADLFKGHFSDAAKGAANALIPFWDPFKKDTEETTQELRTASTTMSLTGKNADAYASHLNTAAQTSADLADETAKMRERVLAMVPANQKAKDSISGIEIKLYDAKAAMQDFVHWIDVYMGRVKLANRQTLILPSGHVGNFQHGTRFAPGGLAWVGEAGPELMYVPRGAQISPARQSAAMAGGMTVILNVAGSVVRERELVETIRKGLIQIRDRNGTTGL